MIVFTYALNLALAFYIFWHKTWDPKSSYTCNHVGRVYQKQIFQFIADRDIKNQKKKLLELQNRIKANFKYLYTKELVRCKRNRMAFYSSGAVNTCSIFNNPPVAVYVQALLACRSSRVHWVQRSCASSHWTSTWLFVSCKLDINNSIRPFCPFLCCGEIITYGILPYSDY